jgi:ATP-dependent Clp protease ATP-binding subunit ClpC
MLILDYFIWHYTRAIKQGIIIWKNLLWFLNNFFSLKLLLKTLFQPFKRLQEYRGKGFDLQRFFETLIINIMMRLVGFLMRSIVIILGIIIETFALLGGIIALIFWIFLPLLIFPLILLIPLFYFCFNKKRQEKRRAKFIDNFALIHSLPLKKEQIKKEHLLSAVEWGKRVYEAKQKKSRWWLKENLARIPGIGKNWCYGAAYLLDKFSRDFMSFQVFSSLHSIGHEQKILAIENTLSRVSQANVLLVGEPGTGKRAVVQGFLDLLKKGKIHPFLEYKRLIELDASALVAFAKTKGEIEELLLRIFNEAVSAGNIILVIDNFGKFIKSLSGLNVSVNHLLGPYFNSPNLQLIALEDSSDFKRIIEPDSSLMQYFEIMRVEEPKREELLQILEDAAIFLEKRNGIIITYPTIEEIVRVSNRYLTEGALPERAIDIMEEVVSRVASLRERNFVSPEDVLNFVKEKTKIPIGELEAGEKEKLLNLEEILHQRVINQEEAISAISGAIRRARMEIQETKKPIGSFLFLGPTGVGKTETAKALAEIYFGIEEAMIRFDMTEYQEESGLERLIGDFKTNEPGILATAIREKPYNLTLLDEFEKSHRKVEDLFLQILDEGFFTDGFGQRVNTRNSIIIATSNAASQMIWDMVQQGINPSLFKEKIIDFIQRKGIFRAELLNRFDAIIVFRPLSQENLKKIAKLMLEKLKKRLLEKGLDLIINNNVIEKVVEIGSDPLFGARPIQRTIQEKIEKKIAEGLIAGKIKPGEHLEFKQEEDLEKL